MRRLSVIAGGVIATVLLGMSAVSAAPYDTTLYNGSFTCKGGSCGQWDIPLYFGIAGNGKDSAAAFQDTDPDNYQSAPGALTVWTVFNGGPKSVMVYQKCAENAPKGPGWHTPAAAGENYTYDFWIKVDSLAGGLIH